MRRPFIYPHRSIRGIRITPGKCVLAVLTAVALTLAVWFWTDSLLAIHNQWCTTLLVVSGIPVMEATSVELFSPFHTAPVPSVAVDLMQTRSVELWFLFAVGMLVLLELHRRIALARSFLIFLMTLLVVAAGVVVFHPAGQLSSTEFAQIWLRGELLVWLVLPWFSAGLFVLIQPLFGVGWAVLTQAYAFAWSAVRLAFCLAVMHYSGMLYVPVLWFALGFLADVVYVVVFYSIAVQLAAKRSWGRRAQ